VRRLALPLPLVRGRRRDASNFTGSVRVEPLFQANAPAHASGSLVRFEPGARTAWHTHPLGQILIMTVGTGRVQRWGDPVDEIRQGDVVWIPPGQKHWHGAAPNSTMAHIAIVEQLDGKAVEWMEQVSDAQYGAPLRAQGASTDAGAQPRASQRAIGDFAPKLAELTDNVLYGDVWERPELSKRDRSLVTVAALIALNRPDQLRSHLVRARENGVTQEELIETITHLAFYAGWPNAVTAIAVAREFSRRNELRRTYLRVTGANSMSRKHRKTLIALWLIAASLLTSASAQETKKSKPEPLMIQTQGSFAVGGSVTTAPGTFDPIKQGAYNPAGTDPAGQTLHGDHAYVFYQVPVNARKLPLIFWHGHGQSAKTWETTPDGREGFQSIFLRRRFPVYLIDQPRRGRAARGTQPINITAIPDEQLWFGIFRLGAWPDFYPGVQFSRDPEGLNQFFRQMVPNTGPYDVQVNTEAVSALFNPQSENNRHEPRAHPRIMKIVYAHHAPDTRERRLKLVPRVRK
jgi:4-carboxymuconolactone decarboxylase